MEEARVSVLALFAVLHLVSPARSNSPLCRLSLPLLYTLTPLLREICDAEVAIRSLSVGVDQLWRIVWLSWTHLLVIIDHSPLCVDDLLEQPGFPHLVVLLFIRLYCDRSQLIIFGTEVLVFHEESVCLCLLLVIQEVFVGQRCITDVEHLGGGNGLCKARHLYSAELGVRSYVQFSVVFYTAKCSAPQGIQTGGERQFWL